MSFRNTQIASFAVAKEAFLNVPAEGAQVGLRDSDRQSASEEDQRDGEAKLGEIDHEGEANSNQYLVLSLLRSRAHIKTDWEKSTETVSL